MYKFSGFTEKANNALNKSISVAENFGHTYIGSEHILIGLLYETDSVAFSVLQNANVNAQKIEQMLVEIVGKGLKSRLSPENFTPRAKHILELSVGCARSFGVQIVGTEHLLLSILNEGENYATRFLKELGVDKRAIEMELISIGGGIDDETDVVTKEKQSSNSSTPTLDKFGTDLTKEANDKKLDPVIGRTEEIERVVQILTRRTKNNPCLIGEPGVGKTAIAEGLAIKIAEGEVPELLKDKRVIALDLTSMVAGTKYRGDFEERITKAVEEVKNSTDVILFIDELHTIVGAGSAEGSTDAANILKPSLARGEFQIIGATTLNEYRKFIEKDAALERRFQPVTVGEPSEEETVLILKGLRDKYEAHHKVKITDGALEAAVNLSSRYITDRFLPDKAIDLIDEAASKVRLTAYTAPDDIKVIEEKLKEIALEKASAVSSQDFEKAAKLRDDEKELQEKLLSLREEWKEKNANISEQVTENEIAAVVSSWTGVPVVKLTEEESEKLLNMEEVLHERIVGQNEAVSSVSRAIRRGRVGLKDPKRPTGSFIFLGPTGVGKTELCKTLAESVFGDEKSLIRFDMSEYMEKHTVSRLVGSPPGYVGYDEGGQLTEKIRRNPYSVVLFDEIEKAHPDVFNILLQILDDGILTDSQGRKVDFKNTIVIMTSNIGARLITDRKSLGFSGGESTLDDNEIKSDVMGELKRHFKPEFLNRVDDIIVFKQLKKEDIKEIAKRLLDTLSKRVLVKYIKLTFTDEAISKIADEGFDPVYGARPLKRAIQSKIEDKLSEELLDLKIKEGMAIVCDFKDDEFVFEKV